MVLIKVLFRRYVVEGLLAMAREIHPNEVIAVLHGDYKAGVLRVEEVSLPPQSVYGEGFSAFNPYAMPIDLTIVGVAHSHPSGVSSPSLEDLNNFMGRVMVILTAPYRGVEDVHVFDGEGNKVSFEVL